MSKERKSFDDKIIFEHTAFGYVNPKAEVVIVGITPGNTKLDGSREGLTPREVKRIYAFSGRMRPNLVNMLNHIGINKMLGIASCKTLWEDDFDRVEMTSLLKEATYELNNKGEKVMFKDTKKIWKSEKLQKMLCEGFVKDCEQYTNAKLFVACGPGVYNTLTTLREQGLINAPIIAIAHPSGANTGRICCYLGTYEPKDASTQWCKDKAEEAKKTVVSLTV